MDGRAPCLSKASAFCGNETTAQAAGPRRAGGLRREFLMLKFLVWCILFVLCWPLALLALVLYPLVWLLLLPFRLVGIAVSGALELIRSIITLPARLIRRI